jgi:putative transposase
VYHVLNRRVMRLRLFAKTADYEAFERVLAAGLARADGPRLLAYCLMPNHWHLVVQAVEDTDLSTWMQWLTVTHTHRWHAHDHSAGQGPLYQGRFKSFPVEAKDYFLVLCRYVEANALRAGLVERAEDWRWGSLHARRDGERALRGLLSEWPVERPRNWLADVNRALGQERLKEVQQALARGTPLGREAWRKRIAARLGLTLRPRGRPRKAVENSF